ncbi:hypothetical protein SAMN05892883_0221 [Jatrophihabitans sp. GAS493]|uniref:hypothetical protein n=1 Tax=Jatrophihabitans sp. GAS493 TaxID=1907575 RepID=UPI000BB6AB24|nr:hypothetical protein [Jatrophihabitans sp. GAS493]SOD70530.1 hypothetical protein SAMN05892883_0221 [Jatrophihabitans sp. GAS493]
MSALPSGPRRLGFAAALSAVVLLSGCAAGQRSGTAQEVPVVDGTGSSIGDCTNLTKSCITLSAVSIVAPESKSYAKGSSAEIQLIIANSGHQDDTLTSVTSDSAATVYLYKNAATASAAAGLAALQSGATDSATPTSSAPTSSAPAESSASDSAGSSAASGSASGSATGSPSVDSAAAQSAAAAKLSEAVAAAAPLSSLDIAAGSRVSIGYGGDASNVLIAGGLKEELFPAQAIKVTFTFASAGTLTLSVPVHLIEVPATPPTVNVAPSGE